MPLVPAAWQLEKPLDRIVGAARGTVLTLQLMLHHPLVSNMSTKLPFVGFYQVESEKDCEWKLTYRLKHGYYQWLLLGMESWIIFSSYFMSHLYDQTLLDLFVCFIWT